MINAADEVRGATVALERVRLALRESLESQPAWRAFLQLEDREQRGEAVSAIDRAELRDRLSQELDRRVAGWRLLAGVEAALAAFKAHGIEASGLDGEPAPVAPAAPVAAVQPRDDVEAVLARIRTIADSAPARSDPVAVVPTRTSFADWGEAIPLSEAPLLPAESLPIHASSPKAPQSPAALPVARVDQLEAELDGLLDTRRSLAHAAETAQDATTSIQPAEPDHSWWGTRDALAEEAEIEIVVLAGPQAAPGPPEMLHRKPKSSTRAEFARTFSEIIDEASVEIVQLDTSRPPAPG